jgi:chemotaxis protein histidine kinase CheA
MGLEIPASGRAEEIALLIFKSGFTTKDHVTSISGRGVGMDAVRSLLEKIGARISIKLRPLKPAGENGRIPFSFQICFPPDLGMEIGVNYEKRALAI